MAVDRNLYWRINGLSQPPGQPCYPTNAFQFLTPEAQSPASRDAGSEPVAGHDVSRALSDPPVSYSDANLVRDLPRANQPLDIVIVGAGLGGLATAIALSLSGHAVRVYEQAPVFGEVGAGIQVPPNSTRHLLAWGVGKHIAPHISEPHGINVRRWDTGNLIGLTQLRPDFKTKYGAPYWVLHRADYHAALLARALEVGVTVHEDHEVLSYSFGSQNAVGSDGRSHGKAVSVSFKNDKSAGADLIIGADGVKSLARSTALKSHGFQPIDPPLTGQAAYRCTVPLSVIASNPQTRWISDAPNQNLWVGPGGHAMTYPIGGEHSPNRLFNLVLSHTEPRPPAEWSKDIDETKAEMRNNFIAFEPRFADVVRTLSEHPKAKVVKWPIVMAEPLETWRHQSQKLVVLGDAAHAMVPYMSQGAAMAVEDAAAMAALLALPTAVEQIPIALEVFEHVRKDRTTGMQQASWLNGEIWHLADGAEQEARDAAMNEDWIKTHGWCTNQWSDPVCQQWTYGYDAVGEAVKAWEARVGRL